jgi:hypothetical protein
VPFRALLRELVTSAPNARGAIFCDYEGENVDLAVADPQPRGCAALSDFDLKVCGASVAASWILLQQHSRAYGAGATLELKIASARGTLLCRSLPDGYYLTLLLAPGPHSEVAASVLRRMAARVEREI